MMPPRRCTFPLPLVALYLGAALVLAGCAPDLVRTTSRATTGNAGWILLSLGPAKSSVYVGAYNVVLREKATGALTSVAFIKDAVFLKVTDTDFSDARGEGAVYLIELPAGEYEVLNYRAALPNHGVESRPGVPIQLTVEQGRTSYLARFLLQAEWDVRPGIFSEKPIYYALRSVSATVIDSYEADVSIAKTRFPEQVRSIAVAKQPQRSIYQ